MPRYSVSCVHILLFTPAWLIFLSSFSARPEKYQKRPPRPPPTKSPTPGVFRNSPCGLRHPENADPSPDHAALYGFQQQPTLGGIKELYARGCGHAVRTHPAWTLRARIRRFRPVRGKGRRPRSYENVPSTRDQAKPGAPSLATFWAAESSRKTTARKMNSAALFYQKRIASCYYNKQIL